MFPLELKAGDVSANILAANPGVLRLIMSIQYPVVRVLAWKLNYEVSAQSFQTSWRGRTPGILEYGQRLDPTMIPQPLLIDFPFP